MALDGDGLANLEIAAVLDERVHGRRLAAGPDRSLGIGLGKVIVTPGVCGAAGFCQHLPSDASRLRAIFTIVMVVSGDTAHDILDIAIGGVLDLAQGIRVHKYPITRRGIDDDVSIVVVTYWDWNHAHGEPGKASCVRVEPEVGLPTERHSPG